MYVCMYVCMYSSVVGDLFGSARGSLRLRHASRRRRTRCFVPTFTPSLVRRRVRRRAGCKVTFASISPTLQVTYITGLVGCPRARARQQSDEGARLLSLSSRSSSLSQLPPCVLAVCLMLALSHAFSSLSHAFCCLSHVFSSLSHACCLSAACVCACSLSRAFSFLSRASCLSLLHNTASSMRTHTNPIL